MSTEVTVPATGVGLDRNPAGTTVQPAADGAPPAADPATAAVGTTHPAESSTTATRPADPATAAAGTATAATGTAAAEPDGEPTDDLEVSIDQDLCTGDGLCVLYAPEVFEFDIDGLAYVKNSAGDLLTEPGSRAPVPAHLRQAVLDAVTDCPGECIYVHRRTGGDDPGR